MNNVLSPPFNRLTIMVSFAAIALTLQATGQFPVVVVERPEVPFVGQDATVESKEKETQGLKVILPTGISKKSFDSILEYLGQYKVAKIGRKETAETMLFWTPDGKPATVAPNEVPVNLTKQMKVGEHCFLFLAPPPTGMPKSAEDKPAFQLMSSVPALVMVNEGIFQQWVRVGALKSKYVNFRLGVRMSEYLGSLPTKPGSTQTVEGIEVKVGDPIPNPTDKRAHIEVRLAGKLANKQIMVMPIIDWEAVQKDAKANDEISNSSSARLIRQAGETLNPDVQRFDVSADIPLKYWSGFQINKITQVQAYISHLPTEPAK